MPLLKVRSLSVKAFSRPVLSFSLSPCVVSYIHDLVSILKDPGKY